jgi:hypothetical protein
LCGLGGVSSIRFSVETKVWFWGGSVRFSFGEATMSSPQFWPEALKQHAEALGYVCIQWANLELEVDAWLANFIPLGHTPINDIVTSEIDFRAKLAIVKNLAYSKSLNPKWFDEVKALLDLIDNQLRCERNRMIHDLWLSHGHENRPARMTRSTKLSKQPGSGDLKLTVNPVAPMPISEIALLWAGICTAQAELLKLRSEWRRAQPPA